jgi:hypothetical protein
MDDADRPNTRDASSRATLPFMDDVYRFANSENPADAETVQETYLRAYRSWHTFQPGSDARRWLFTICRNAFLRSREKLRHEVEVDDSNAETLAAVQAHTEMRQDGSDQILSRVDLARRSPARSRAGEPFRSTDPRRVEDQSYTPPRRCWGSPSARCARASRGRRSGNTPARRLRVGGVRQSTTMPNEIRRSTLGMQQLWTMWIASSPRRRRCGAIELLPVPPHARSPKLHQRAAEPRTLRLSGRYEQGRSRERG